MKDDDTSDHLTDGNPDTFWETDGGVGTHWIKLTMKPGTIIRCVGVRVELFLPVAHHYRDFMAQGKITYRKSVWTPPRPDYQCLYLHHHPIFMPSVLSATALPIYLGLDRNQIMLACVPLLSAQQ